MDYELDRELAKTRGILFEVCSKAGQSQQWITIEKGIRDLDDAMILVNSLDGLDVLYEVGIFVEIQGLGFVYWTTKNPDLFNSSVIQLEVNMDK